MSTMLAMEGGDLVLVVQVLNVVEYCTNSSSEFRKMKKAVLKKFGVKTVIQGGIDDQDSCV